MKRHYTKPMLYAERFALVEHISQSCAFVTNFGNGCPIEEGGMRFFTTASVCSDDAVSMWQFAGVTPENATIQDLSKLNIRCYNSFRDFNALYTS